MHRTQSDLRSWFWVLVLVVLLACGPATAVADIGTGSITRYPMLATNASLLVSSGLATIVVGILLLIWPGRLRVLSS